MSVVTVAAYLDDGFSALCLRICSFSSTSWPNEMFPPRGFVGLDYPSSQVIDLSNGKLSSIRLRPIPCTRDAHLWRLTCEWEISPQALRPMVSGRSSAAFGGSSAGAGAGRSPRPTSITSISPPWTLGRVGSLRAPHPPD